MALKVKEYSFSNTTSHEARGYFLKSCLPYDSTANKKRREQTFCCRRHPPRVALWETQPGAGEDPSAPVFGPLTSLFQMPCTSDPSSVKEKENFPSSLDYLNMFITSAMDTFKYLGLMREWQMFGLVAITEQLTSCSLRQLENLHEFDTEFQSQRNIPREGVLSFPLTTDNGGLDSPLLMSHLVQFNLTLRSALFKWRVSRLYSCITFIFPANFPYSSDTVFR